MFIADYHSKKLKMVHVDIVIVFPPMAFMAQAKIWTQISKSKSNMLSIKPHWQEIAQKLLLISLWNQWELWIDPAIFVQHF